MSTGVVTVPNGDAANHTSTVPFFLFIPLNM
jgi:hypothetical protein